MSYGCLINVINLTNHEVTLSVGVLDANDWEDSTLTPAQFNGAVIAKNSQEEQHVELTNSATSAKFVITFAVNGETIEAVADAYPVAVKSGNRKGELWITGGSPFHFKLLEAQYPKQPGDTNDHDWRHLGIIIMPRIDPRKWMSGLDPDTMLHQLTVPGTHDSGTAAIIGPDPTNRARVCQGLSLAQQLNIGVRFLDIRLNKSRNWEIMHEGSPTGLFFVNDCLLPIAEFFLENPEETILLCIKDERGSTDGFHDDILEMLGKMPSYVFEGQHPPNLGQLRGKIVLLRRYWIDPATNQNQASGANSGIGLHEFNEFGNGTGTEYAWPDNSDTFKEYGKDTVIYQQPGGLPVVIQDWYDIHDHYLSAKIDLITNTYMDTAMTKLPDAWFINFASCCTTTRLGYPKDFAVGEGNVNDSLFLFAITHGKGRYGIIPMDFAGTPPEEATVDLLINSNYR